jgi:hypothetical protein
LPAKDHCHDKVVLALLKDGWTIDAEQVLFIISNRHVWIDIQASREATTILVEVKSFRRPSPVEELTVAVGQYTVYRAVIDNAGGANIPLYIAVPVKAYQSILGEQYQQRGSTAFRRYVSWDHTW